jgi:hypothetical protein
MLTRFNQPFSHPVLALLALLGVGVAVPATLNAADNVAGTPSEASYVPPSDKGGFQYSEPTPYPELNLDLSPIEKQVAEQASTRCATSLAAAPLDLGDADGIMGELMGKAAGAAIGQLLGGFLGGGGGSKKKPDLYKDPIKKKYKQRIDHPSGDARIRIGGQAYSDGLLLSARVEKAAGKGTFHTMFLEFPDCTRIWPEKYLGYGLWGSWSLSVSVTRTTSSYQNGELVDRSVSQSGWTKSGDFDFSRGFSLWDQIPGEDLHLILNPDDAYLAQLRKEIDVPAWQAMGYAEPTEGVRSAGGLFKVSPDELPPGTIAVVHITHVEKGRYKTVGFPLDMSFGEEGRLSFEQLASGATD